MKQLKVLGIPQGRDGDSRNHSHPPPFIPEGATVVLGTYKGGNRGPGDCPVSEVEAAGVGDSLLTRP